MWKVRSIAWLAAGCLLTACSGSEGPAGDAPSRGASGGTGAGAGSSGAAGAPSGGAAGAPSGGQSSAGAGASGGSLTQGGGGTGATTAAGGFGGAPEDKPGTVEIGVRNLCPFPIWIHASGASGVLQPDDAELSTDEIIWYDAPAEWAAARLTAYDGGPRQGEVEKVEMTFETAEDGVVLNYNITYVDWLGLPIEMESEGDGDDCETVGCYVPQSEVLTGCPDDLLDGNRCLAARTYCMDAENQSGEFCTRLDAEIARCAATQSECAGASGATTGEAYACSGAFFSASPKWCAALNRGMVDDPDSTDLGAYYQSEPYNTYSKWVHEVCPGIYAFPYDDYPSNVGESGFHACRGGRELRVTFCPAG